MTETSDAQVGVASVRLRAAGYAVDMVIFAAVAMLMLVLSGFVLLWITEWATQDPGDSDINLFLGLNGVGLPLLWSALNIALLASRGQTGGQYVAGVRIVRENGDRLSFATAALWWVAFNPLLFSWPLAAVSGLPVAAFIIVGWAEVMTVVWGLFITLCLACPIIAFISGWSNSRSQAFHDRIVGVIAVPVE